MRGGRRERKGIGRERMAVKEKGRRERGREGGREGREITKVEDLSGRYGREAQKKVREQGE